MVSQKANSYPIAVFPYQWLFETKQQVEGLIYQLMGRQKACILRRFLQLFFTERSHSLIGGYGIVSAGLGKKEEALRFGRRGVELSPVSKDAVVGPWHVEDFPYICVL